MSAYLVRKTGFKKYEIAKFEDSADPLDVYTISSRGCSCPARMANCKHTRILKIWLKTEPLGVVYDENGVQLNQLAVA